MCCVRLEWKQSLFWSCGKNQEVSVRRFSPEPKPIHNHSTLERGLSPPTCPCDDRPEPPAHTDTSHAYTHTLVDLQSYAATCVASIKYENTHCLRHRHTVCQGSIKALVFFCAGWSQWPDENVILHCVLNGSTWELSEGWGDCKETHTYTHTLHLLVFTVITCLQYIMPITVSIVHVCVLTCSKRDTAGQHDLVCFPEVHMYPSCNTHSLPDE